MSTEIPLQSKPKSPYKNLLSSSKGKMSGGLARKIYMNELSSKHKIRSIESEQYRRYNSSSRNVSKGYKLDLTNRTKSNEKTLLSDRKSLDKKMSLFKHQHSTRGSKFSKNKLLSSTSRLEKPTDKSTAISSLLSNHQQRQAKLKEERRKHQQGKNCRIVVIEGQEQTQIFVQVNQMGDILSSLKKEYPRIIYYRAVPVQITLDYLLTQSKINGSFLNGQTLYLKPASKVNSVSQRDSLCLQDFQIIKMIGSGGFSQVFLCRFKRDGNFYAMKVIDKDVIVKNKKKNIIMNQRNIMKSSQHPFLIDLKFAFQTNKSLIFIVQYCPGGQLFGLIKKYKRITEDIARFYIIQIFLGLSYLHQNQIVYRDIKPQNILLGQDGHVKIADLGLAKPDMYQGQLAYSFCGSPEYMSPEMILQVGHTFPVDYYCMGALLYELLIGLPPFYSRDTNQIYQAVLAQDLQFPQQVPLSSQCKSLLRGLLCKQSKQRLGSIHGVKQILAHPWFGKNSYKNFLQKKIQPPITFDSVGRIDLDKTDQKHRKALEQMLRLQKQETPKFKREMKNFYYDYTSQTQETLQIHRQSNKPLVRTGSANRFHTALTSSSGGLLTTLRRKSSQKDQSHKTLNSSRR